MAEKKQDFVVSDRRRFGSEGDLRPDAPSAAEEEQPVQIQPPTAQPPAAATAPPPAAPAEPAKPPLAAGEAKPDADDAELPEPPTPEEEQQQTAAYSASGRKIDDFIKSSGAAPQSPLEMNFERVVESFYMSALIQMGAIRQEGETPRIDIIGARQTIDSLNVLMEKTKGNLTDREKTLLQNVLFELRMAFIEITNAIASGPPPGQGPGAGKGPAGPGIISGLEK
jgi:hypothetical protein